MKPCNINHEKDKDSAYICNPQTGRWVKRDGHIGKKLIENEKKNLPKIIDTKIKIVGPVTKIPILVKKAHIQLDENKPIIDELIQYKSLYYLPNDVKSSRLAVSS